MNDKSFKTYYREQSFLPVYILLGLFILSTMLLVINFIDPVAETVNSIRLIINSAVIICGPLYFCFQLLLWKRSLTNAIISIFVIAGVFLGWNYLGQTAEIFFTVASIILALLLYGSDFRIILKIYLFAHIITVLGGAVGLLFGFAELRYKVFSTTGFSLGLIYPNHLARMIFIILMITWYLWGQEKRVITTIVFFITSYYMWTIVKCRTITIFMVGLPVCWWISSILQNRRINEIVKKIWNSILIAMPFLCFIATYILGKMRVWLDSLSHYGTGLYALLMRFISAGILFDHFGFPLFGRDIYSEDAPMEFFNNHSYNADIVDNAYIFYLVAIGLILLVICMGWISFANYRAIKNNDCALVLISVFMCGYGLIETVFFQFEHNFIFFYPLTATAMMYKSVKTNVTVGTNDEDILEAGKTETDNILISEISISGNAEAK